jgi:hypothetical protein
MLPSCRAKARHPRVPACDSEASPSSIGMSQVQPPPIPHAWLRHGIHDCLYPLIPITIGRRVISTFASTHSTNFAVG